MLEKPIAVSADGARRIIAAAEAARLTLFVGENAQYWTEVCAVLRVVGRTAGWLVFECVCVCVCLCVCVCVCLCCVVWFWCAFFLAYDRAYR
jgi:hypothetical protein